MCEKSTSVSAVSVSLPLGFLVHASTVLHFRLY
jgi:hypothetical protein